MYNLTVTDQGIGRTSWNLYLDKTIQIKIVGDW